MKNKSLFIIPIVLYATFILFVSYFAFGWNEMTAVDNAEHLAVDMRPWWKQIRYFLYVAISFIPASLIYITIGKSFFDNKIPFKFKLGIAATSLLIFFASGVYGTAKGIVTLQNNTLSDIKILKAHG